MSFFKKLSLPDSAIGFAVAVPVVLIIGLAGWLAVASVVENIRFGRATDQILGLVFVAHDYATRQPRFTMQSGDDLLASLKHLGQIPTPTDSSQGGILNPWNGSIRAPVLSSTTYRLEMDLPPRACRRLALFFIGYADTMALQGMETPISRSFYDASQKQVLDDKVLETACGEAPQVSLALILRLR